MMWGGECYGRSRFADKHSKIREGEREGEGGVGWWEGGGAGGGVVDGGHFNYKREGNLPRAMIIRLVICFVS